MRLFAGGRPATALPVLAMSSRNDKIRGIDARPPAAAHTSWLHTQPQRGVTSMSEQTLKPTKRRHGDRGPRKRRPPIKMWSMTGRMERRAALVAADELTDVEIAERIGVHRTTLEK